MTRIVRAAIAGGALIATLGLAACTGTNADIKTADPKPSASRPAASPEAEADTAPTYSTPKPSDFTIKVRETSRENFGSAGDLVEYKLELIQVNSKNFDPETTYDLKYKVIGDENGPSTDTIELQGDSYEQPYEGMASTYSGGKVTAKVVSIIEA